MDAGKLDRRITIMQRSTTQESVYGTQSVAWVPLATVWADVQDMLPSRAERVAEGVNIAMRPCRVRIRYRDDVTAAMRMTYAGRTYQILSQPAELEGREGLEFTAEQLSTQGQEP